MTWINNPETLPAGYYYKQGQSGTIYSNGYDRLYPGLYLRVPDPQTLIEIAEFLKIVKSVSFTPMYEKVERLLKKLKGEK